VARYLSSLPTIVFGERFSDSANKLKGQGRAVRKAQIALGSSISGKFFD